ncbi:hypothetical protein BB559_001194, partial [Furculomyces boomerangus]
ALGWILCVSSHYITIFKRLGHSLTALEPIKERFESLLIRFGFHYEGLAVNNPLKTLCTAADRFEIQFTRLSLIAKGIHMNPRYLNLVEDIPLERSSRKELLEKKLFELRKDLFSKTKTVTDRIGKILPESRHPSNYTDISLNLSNRFIAMYAIKYRMKQPLQKNTKTRSKNINDFINNERQIIHENNTQKTNNNQNKTENIQKTNAKQTKKKRISYAEIARSQTKNNDPESIKRLQEAIRKCTEQPLQKNTKTRSKNINDFINNERQIIHENNTQKTNNNQNKTENIQKTNAKQTKKKRISYAEIARSQTKNNDPESIKRLQEAIRKCTGAKTRIPLNNCTKAEEKHKIQESIFKE